MNYALTTWIIILLALAAAAAATAALWQVERGLRGLRIPLTSDF